MVSAYMSLSVLCALVWTVSVQAQTPLNEVRSTVDKWVETRQLISKTKSEWQSDKDLLEQSVRVFERELKAVEEQFVKLGTNSAQVERERTAAEASLKSSNESLARAKQFAADFEGRIANLIPQLPAPLQETLKPLVALI